MIIIKHIVLPVMLVLCIANFLSAQQSGTYVLSYDEEVTNSFVLRDASNNSIAGNITVGLSLSKVSSGERIGVRLHLPEGLSRGYSDLIIFDVDGSRNIILQNMKDQANINFTIRPGFPLELSKYVDVPEGYGILQAENYFDAFHAIFNKTFEAGFELNRTGMAPGGEFTMIVNLYFGSQGRRNRVDFMGGMQPFSLRIILPGEPIAVSAPATELISIDPIESTVPTPVQPETQVVRTPREGTTELRDTAMAAEVPEAGSSEAADNAQIVRAMELLRQCKQIYNNVFIVYSAPDRSKVDKSGVMVLQEQIMRTKLEFDQVMSDLNIQDARQRMELNEFGQYYEFTQDYIRRLLGASPDAASTPVAADTNNKSQESSFLKYMLIGVGLMILCVILIIFFMKWQQKIKMKRLQGELKRKAKIEMHKQTFGIRNQQSKFRI